MRVTGACRRRKAIRVARTGVSDADIMRSRKGVQERVRVDRLAATASESLSEFISARFSERFSGRSETIARIFARRLTELAKRSADGSDTEGSRTAAAARLGATV